MLYTVFNTPLDQRLASGKLLGELVLRHAWDGYPARERARARERERERQRERDCWTGIENVESMCVFNDHVESSQLKTDNTGARTPVSKVPPAPHQSILMFQVAGKEDRTKHVCHSPGW